MSFYRFLGTAAAVAVVGAVAVGLSRLLDKKAPIQVLKTEFPEQAEDDPQAAAETAAAYAEATAASAKAEAAQAAAASEAAQPAPEQETAGEEPPAEAESAAEKQPAEEEPAEAAPEAEQEPAGQPAPQAEEVSAPKKSARPRKRSRKAADPDGPNPNPVEAGPAVAPKDADGKFDPTQIASPDDFANWEELGCQS